MGRKKESFYKTQNGQQGEEEQQQQQKPVATGKRAKALQKYANLKVKEDARAGLLARLASVNSPSPDNSAQLVSTKQMLSSSKRMKERKDKKATTAKSIQPEEEKCFVVPASSTVSKKKAIIKVSRDSSDSDEDESTPFKKKKVAKGSQDGKEIIDEPEEQAYSKGGGLNPGKAWNVPVDRPAELEAEREALPIHSEEHTLLHAILNHPVTIVTGATGSGKTTQLPQFLYEAGFGNGGRGVAAGATDRSGQIVVTQPRRVAAIAMAARVQYELAGAAKVAHHVRFDVKDESADGDAPIKFVTEGILLRELQCKDALLLAYSVVIIDEAHERTLNGDLLLGALVGIVRLRNGPGSKHPPLRVVIMSATLATRLFAAPHMFPQAPLVTVPTRQHPITMHYAKKTREDYVGSAVRMAQRVHEALPPGGILIFMTGRREVDTVAKRLCPSAEDSQLPFDDDEEFSDLPEEIRDNSSEDEDDFSPEDFKDNSNNATNSKLKLRVLPLYAMMDVQSQQGVLQYKIDPTERLCVVATNVAETSLTIPGIRYVIDSGRVKERRATSTHTVTGITWISKASAEQRAGRAGRTGPGHVYRLYSSSVMELCFPAESEPESSRTPLPSVLLQLHGMGLCSKNGSALPLPTPLPQDAVIAARAELVALQAIQPHNSDLSPLGEAMLDLPIPPHCARIVLDAIRAKEPLLISLATTLAALLAYGTPICDADRMRTAVNAAPRARFAHLDSDPLHWLSIFLEYSATYSSSDDLCNRYGVLKRRLDEARLLTRQLTRHIKNTMKVDSASECPPSTISHTDAKKLRHLLRAALPLKTAIRVSASEIPREACPGQRLPKHPAYRILSTSGEVEGELCWLHPSSALYKAPPKKVCFLERESATIMIRSRDDNIEHPHYILYIRDITALSNS